MRHTYGAKIAGRRTTAGETFHVAVYRDGTQIAESVAESLDEARWRARDIAAALNRPRPGARADAGTVQELLDAAAGAIAQIRAFYKEPDGAADRLQAAIEAWDADQIGLTGPVHD